MGKLKEALKTIESIVNASIKAKVGSHATYKRHCQGRLGTRGIGINPPKQLPYSAEMVRYDLNDLEECLLQNAESKMMKDYECSQRAFPPTGFKTAVELRTVFANLKRHFGNDATAAFMKQFNAADLSKMIPCNHCSSDTYSDQLVACKSLAAVSPTMARLVAAHGEDIATLAQAKNEDNDVTSRTDALAKLQSATTHSCTGSNDEETDAIKAVFQKIVSNVEEGVPTAIDELDYLKRMVNDLPKGPFWVEWGPWKTFRLSEDISKLLEKCTAEQYNQLPKVALRAEAAKWLQNLRAAKAIGNVHRITEILIAQPKHSASGDDVLQAASACWSTIVALAKSSVLVAISNHSLEEVVEHKMTIAMLNAERPQIEFDTVLETLELAAYLLAQQTEIAIKFDGFNVNQAVTLTPEEARFGCTVRSSRFGGLQDVEISRGAVDFANTEQQLVEPGRGLRDFQSTSYTRGNLILTVTVSGRPEARQPPLVSKTVQSSEKLNKHQKKASTIVPGAVGCISKLACVDAAGRLFGSGGVGAAGSAAIFAPVPPPSAAPVVKGQGARDAVSDAVVNLCNYVKTDVIIDAFKHAVGFEPDAPVDVVAKAYDRASKRAFANVDFEFRAQDKMNKKGEQGDQAKAMFLLASSKLLFPSSLEEKERQTAYNGLCARLIKPRLDSPRRLGTSAPFREDVIVLIDVFLDVNKGTIEVAPITRKETRHSSAFDFNNGGESVPTHSSKKVIAGAGKEHKKHPWRGDVVEEIVVSDTAECTINGTVCTVTREALQWDLKVEYALSSFEACVGAATLHLVHPDGQTYCMDLQAADCNAGGSDSGSDGFKSMFTEGCYVYLGVGLGAATSTGGRGDLAIVLRSNLQVPA